MGGLHFNKNNLWLQHLHWVLTALWLLLQLLLQFIKSYSFEGVPESEFASIKLNLLKNIFHLNAIYLSQLFDDKTSLQYIFTFLDRLKIYIFGTQSPEHPESIRYARIPPSVDLESRFCGILILRCILAGSVQQAKRPSSSSFAAVVWHCRWQNILPAFN